MSEAMTVLRPNADALAVLDDLSRPLEERLLGPIAQAGYDAPLPVLTERPEPLTVRYTDRGTTLTAADYLHDPHVAQDGGLIRAPKSVQKQFKDFEQHGIDPDRLWILRETPGVWRPGETPPRMMGLETAETARTKHLQHLQVGAAAFAVGKGLLYVAGGALVVATGVVVAAGAITVGAIGAVAMAPLADGLDPIVLAGIDDPKTGAVAWVVIGSWDEIADERSW
jgi:hypothetical protein